MSYHNAETGSSLHSVHAFTYADAAARNAAVLTSGDIGKIALQSDSGDFYILEDDSPLTWKGITTSDGGTF